MPEIFLRAYGREIDELIERERLEEAIAHCRYILQTYPKHLETYRFLGKAYLEAKRYGDAADIFQRVLSAIPDDFVSHVGMAIVREDEGNLDAAIWHMERAFETNPSNPAIQQEMKRLISRRDGLEPHKVRLTRGALARMYAHGELFAQAIAELRSALQEDPERPDLQVLLASMYWQTDQRSDATSVSNQILEKLPYCWEANRILAANLQASDRVEEAAVYHRRLAGLDPYAAFVESALADSNGIEESAVSLEKLDWVAGEPIPSGAPGQPGWATTLGMEMQEPGEELPEEVKPPETGPLPSWLEPGEPPPFEAAAEEEIRVEMETRSTDASADESGAEFFDELEADSSDDADFIEPEPMEKITEAGFLDEWEAETVDEGDLFEAEPAEKDAEAGFLDELEAEAADEADLIEPELAEKDAAAGGIGVVAAAGGLAAGVLAGGDEDESEEAIEEEISPEAEAAVGAGMFDQAETEDFSRGELDLTDEGSFGEPDEELPASEEVEPSVEAEIGEEPIATGDTSESEIPDWMTEAGWTESSGETEEAPISFSEQELDALDAGKISADIPEDEDTELTPAELPEWIHDIAPEDVEGSVDDGGPPGWIPSPEAEDQDIAQMEAAGEDGEGDTSFPVAEPDTSKLPTWITEDSPGATETIVTWLEDKGEDSVEEDLAEGEDLPEWMKDTGPLEESLDAEPIDAEQDAEPSTELQMEETADEPQARPSAETPSSESWLSAVAAVAADEEAGPSSSDGAAEETPDWLEESRSGEIEPDLGLTAAAAAGMFAGEEEDESQSLEASDTRDRDQEEGPISFVAETETSEEVDQAEAPSFAEEAEILEPEGPAEARPLGEEAPAEAEASREEAPSLATEAETIDQPEASKAPDWLEEIGTLPQQPVETDSADWLEGVEIEDEETATPETPDWLKGLAEEGADGEESGAASAPDWLREIGDPESVGQEAEGEGPREEMAEQPAAEDSGRAPDWLKGTETVMDEEAVEEITEAAEPEPEPEAPPMAAEEDDEVMDWLEELAAKQAEAPDDEEIEAAAQVAAAAPVLEERDIPDEPEEGLEWLEQLADQRGIDVDVGLPSQATGEVSEPEPELEPEIDTSPDWLGRMATQPLPEIDMEAMDAAVRGEEVSPDAETIEADIQAQLDEVILEPEAEVGEGPAAVAPDDVTIEARASDLHAQMEAAEQEAEEEVPDWLISAAEQTEAPSEVLPDVFAEDVAEPEPDAEPELAGEQEFHAETVQASEPVTVDEPVSDTEQEAAISEPISEAEDLAEVQRVADMDTEQKEPVELVAADQVEPIEATEPEDLEIAEPLEADERAAGAEPILVEGPAVEVKKKEELLERSRQALASGDTQAAAEMYGEMVKRKESLESVIEDLRIAVDRTPDNADLWQVLGDAYMRDDQTDEAIDAYRKGMEAA